VPSRRDQIKLTAEEQAELLDTERVVIVSSIGPRGWPHSMPLWYVVRGGEIWVWTYAKSQKVKNLERDPRATLLIEPKRVVIRFQPKRTATWDHRKLGGTY
jgi:nitroimidazol reductase NimA-like FMN-containing flavoprotein (pyridoxamine 5'-phosphate oxidase superfamily)